MKEGRSWRFTHAVSRLPGMSIANGLRAGAGADPDPAEFLAEHQAYTKALAETGANVTVLDALEAFPDSVFVEDAALCAGGTAIILRPGAESRFGEAAEITPALEGIFGSVKRLERGLVDGGDILLTDDATMNSKPELEIYADDVRCSHGSTTGQLDEDAVFYLRARGLDEFGATALLLTAFAGEALNSVSSEELRNILEQKIQAKLKEMRA